MLALAVGMQIMAYGASKPVPFQQGICQSGGLEPGITANFTIDAMQAVVDYVDCDASGLHSKETVACLRNLDMQTLLDASLVTYPEGNGGDIWLPAVDGDFLPAAPSTLIREGRLANVTTMIGWCEDDLTFFTDFTIKTSEDTRRVVAAYAPGLTSTNVDKLLSLYPVSDFAARATSNLSSEFFRTARIFRDMIMTCPPMWYGQHIAAAGGNNNNNVYLYDWNQTILEPIIDEASGGLTGFGVIHTSEFAYIFGNLSHYNISGLPFHPTPDDYRLAERGSRSWSTFAATGIPSLDSGHNTFQGFTQAFPAGGGGDEDVYIFVAGGPSEGLSAIDGPQSKGPMSAQELRERCGFLNSPEVIEQLRY
jgi:carboxylesterase type B